MTNRFDGKVALVTGGSRGIGAAIARRLAAEGADVVLTYGGSQAKAEAVAEEIRGMGRKAEAVHCDAAQRGTTAAVIADVANRYGRLDVLVNNAGVYPLTSLAKCSDEVWDNMLAINLTAVFEGLRAAYQVMGAGGSIVTIGSVAGDAAQVAGVGVYSSSKAGVELITRAAGREFGRKGIRANVVQPGPIDTDMNPADGQTADLQKMMVPLGRYGEADEVAAAVAFLASDEASYINGTTLKVCGGMTA
ncbi:SDR family oxidoreductase [Hyphobacterium sp. HN65]|uniref:SDR family oxidoreductase n=1 Tax=Hyphobacterium lacteum TaxID=3116575 RepID=A0ABU7LMI4_9PROT|nr:SDR family oxidoreductase [Hyphobacterium sp. HN65]MEE2525138.1 SDR family oxidoreductase [Hyphobacterium sp. HN65]